MDVKVGNAAKVTLAALVALNSAACVHPNQPIHQNPPTQGIPVIPDGVNANTFLENYVYPINDGKGIPYTDEVKARFERVKDLLSDSYSIDKREVVTKGYFIENNHRVERDIGTKLINITTKLTSQAPRISYTGLVSYIGFIIQGGTEPKLPKQ